MLLLKRAFCESLSNIYSNEEINALFKICLFAIKGEQSSLTIINDKLNESEIAQLNCIVLELLKRRPIQYILGQTFFGEHLLYVDEAVLIPRPETEELCLICDKIIKTKKYKSMLDIGTGSGCISIYLKSKNKSLQVTAIDISKAALEVAKRNAFESNTEITFLTLDILATDILINEIDLIVSNPPYIGIGEINNIDFNVKDNEPHIALFVPDNNELIFYKRIINISKTCLSKNGSIAFECNQKYCSDVADLLVQASFKDVRIQKDMYNNERFVIGSKSII